MINLCKLKCGFTDIKHLRESVLNLLKSLREKADLLNEIYKELLTKNVDETDTGLDSFYFQNKLIDIEICNNRTTFKIIDNRIYADYYKLFKIMVKFLNENIKNKNITSAFDNKIYPVYKDLKNVEYDFNYTIEIYNDIIQILDILHNELMSREHKLNMQKIKQKSGLNIDNLINNVNYNNNFLKNHIILFNEYLIIYNNFHTKYLTRFSLKTKLFYGQICSDIRIEEAKTSIDCHINDGAVNLDENEEKDIRNLISDDTTLNDKIQLDTKKNIKNELDCMISNISESASNRSLEHSASTNDNENISDIASDNMSPQKKRAEIKEEKKFIVNKNLSLTNQELEYGITKELLCNIDKLCTLL